MDPLCIIDMDRKKLLEKRGKQEMGKWIWNGRITGFPSILCIMASYP